MTSCVIWRYRENKINLKKRDKYYKYLNIEIANWTFKRSKPTLKQLTAELKQGIAESSILGQLI